MKSILIKDTTREERVRDDVSSSVRRQSLSMAKIKKDKSETVTFVK